ncbi:MAG: (d)CMP kinase [Cellulosilyticaceae bacterium]
MNQFSIALDGPAGAGKSTIAKTLAKTLGCVYIDTGAMYRTVGLYCILNDINYNEEMAVVKELTSIHITITYSNEQQHIFLNDKDVSLEIRTQEVAAAASKVATYKDVRKYLVDLQRKLASEVSVVMDGRDIGTVVLPEATLKIFLTASAKVRAERRKLEYAEKGVAVSLDQLIREINDRDEQDSNRKESPLKKAEDAVEVDSSDLNAQEVVETIINLLTNRRQAK